MKFVYIDGDDIGLRIENSFLNNDESTLQKVNMEVKLIINKITDFLTSKDYNIIFSGADGIICKGDNVDVQSLLDFTRQLNNGFTFSLGSSNSLRGAYIALRYAKSINKNVAVEYQNNLFTVTK